MIKIKKDFAKYCLSGCPDVDFEINKTKIEGSKYYADIEATVTCKHKTVCAKW